MRTFTPYERALLAALRNDGLEPTARKLTGFAAVCYNDSSVAELVRQYDGPSFADVEYMRARNLTPRQWDDAICKALERMMHDAERSA